MHVAKQIRFVRMIPLAKQDSMHYFCAQGYPAPGLGAIAGAVGRLRLCELMIFLPFSLGMVPAERLARSISPPKTSKR
jgi:hypothetical protein